MSLDGSTLAPQSLFAVSPREEAIEALHAATAIYTAAPVVDQLLDRVHWPAGDRSLCDPSSGDGAFLANALHRLLKEEPAATPDRLLSRVEGWEIHRDAAEASRRRIVQVLRDHQWTAGAALDVARRMIISDDFLTGCQGHRTYDILAGNPPYLRYAHVPELLRSEYEVSLPAYAQNDLLHSFLAACAERLSADGEIAFVTADRWLFNLGAAGLREALGKRLGIEHIERLDPDTAFYRPKLRRAGTPPRVHPVAVVLRRQPSRISLSRAAVYPDAVDEHTENGVTLGDIASVHICPWLGKEGIFVVSAADASGLPADCIVPAVDTDDIVDGSVVIGRRFAIRSAAGSKPTATVAAHLRSRLSRLCPTGKRRKDWWLPPEPWTDDQISGDALLVPRIATGLRCYRLPAGVLAINHNLTVIRPGRAGLVSLAALLDSERARRWVHSRAPRLENGYLSITPTLLRQLPVDAATPAPDGSGTGATTA